MKDKNTGPRNPDADRRAEHEFDVITFVLAGLLALIILSAVGYGIFGSTEVASTLPMLNKSSEIAGKAAMPASTDDSATNQQKSSAPR